MPHHAWWCLMMMMKKIDERFYYYFRSVGMDIGREIAPIKTSPCSNYQSLTVHNLFISDVETDVDAAGDNSIGKAVSRNANFFDFDCRHHLQTYFHQMCISCWKTIGLDDFLSICTSFRKCWNMQLCHRLVNTPIHLAEGIRVHSKHTINKLMIIINVN